AQPLVAKAIDALGNGVAGIRVDFAAVSGGGSVSPAFANTGADGTARVTAILGPSAGPNGFEASNAALAGSPVRYGANGLAGPAAKLVVVSGDGQSGPVGSALPQPLTVAALDAFANPVGGVSLSFAATSGGGSIAPASTSTLADGTASATATLGTAAGANGFAAASAGLTG